ncbi:MAG TPA: hypothetical protein VFX59_23330 [Polyangiales bacterium]|nr:hypothetical protein [Polyangiales bacterium]
MPAYAYAYAMLVGLAISYTYCHRDVIRSIFGERIRLKGDASLALPKSWAIAAGADLAVRNAQYSTHSPAASVADPPRVVGIASREAVLETIRELDANDGKTHEAVESALKLLHNDGLHTPNDPPRSTNSSASTPRGPNTPPPTSSQEPVAHPRLDHTP